MDLYRIFKRSGALLFALGSMMLMESCSTAPNNSKYFGYNNNPEREQEPEITRKTATPRESRAVPQEEEEWVNPLANQRSESDMALEKTVTEREGTVINNYYYYQPRGYVPVIQPWYTGYRGWAAPRPGLTVTVGSGLYYSSNPFYDPWYDWYNPWYDYHPYYGTRWTYYRSSNRWFDDPWRGRTVSRRAYREPDKPSQRRTSGGVTRSSSPRRDSDVNRRNGVSSTKYGTSNTRNSENSSGTSRGSRERSRYNNTPNNSGGSRYSPPPSGGSRQRGGGSSASPKSGGSGNKSGGSSGGSRGGNSGGGSSSPRRR